ncbi:nitrate- and nitrite sensing domain-containing protein [Actinomadura gamaensis]|uniref:histidine kinase n=1 Tax=Actinomadura gamaensis TaxID=1763541 RepID=A0ABV9U6B5_9ACTN
MPVRLVALILIPTAVAVVLGGLRVLSADQDAKDYAKVERMARLGGSVTDLVHELGTERDLSAGYIAAGRPASGKAPIDQQYAKVDRIAAEVRRRVDTVVSSDGDNDVRALVTRLDGLTALRQLTQARVPADTVTTKYSEMLGEVIGYLDDISGATNDAQLTSDTRALAALSRAAEQASRQRAVLLAGANVGRLDTDGLRNLLDGRAQMDGDLANFRTAARLPQRQLYDDTVTGPDVDRAAEFRERALTESLRGSKLRLVKGGNDGEEWRKAMTGTVDKMYSVQRSMIDGIITTAGQRKSDAQQSVYAQGAVVAGVLILVLLFTFGVARSLVRPLRRLKDGALEIAGTRLPGLVDRLRDPEAAAQGIEVEPIDVDSTDEIGQVARAFDEVHREAVRLAADEAVLRGNINAMFVNLSRRSQTLIERQLQLIEELEQSERDEEQLSNLFRLDHLATRMRRNNENLLVLGGQDQARRWNRPVPFIDVVRASLSEVEQYERVEVRVHGDMTVAGPVVNDLVHLLAELVENATVFSDGRTRVTVSGQRLSGGGAMLQITDNGVGMTAEELDQANWRLANPPVIDFSAARRMGLFVVGRLAIRHGIRVELRAAQGGGLTAFVMLPDHVVSPVDNASVGTRGAGGTAQLEGGPVPALAAPAATAVEDRPGFGDHPSGAYQNGAHPGAEAPGAPRFGENGTRFDGQPGRRFGDTGPQPVFGGTGDQRDLGYGGADDRMDLRHDPRMDPRMDSRTDSRADGPGDGAGTRPPAPHGEDEPSRSSSTGLPVRRPGAQLPGVGTPSDNVFQPSDRSGQDPRASVAPAASGAWPASGHDDLGHDGPRQDVPRQDGRHDVPQPDGRHHDTPHADRTLADRAPIDRTIDRAPLDRTHADRSAPADRTPAAEPYAGDPGVTAPLPQRSETSEPAPARRAFSWDTGPVSAIPEETNNPEDAIPEQTNRPPTRQRPDRAPVAPQAGPPAAPPASPPAGAARAAETGPPPAPQRPPGRPARSPIFEAMQSEWFQRGSGESADPVKGWSSPADEAFQAVEALREPVADKQTRAGLPKRVPGRNRVPGAVGARNGANGNGAQAAPANGAAPMRGAGGQPGAPAGPARPAAGPPADTVRNRFASLQRGVQRGRTEARGATPDLPGGGGPADGTTGEDPSRRSGGETGGTR